VQEHLLADTQVQGAQEDIQVQGVQLVTLGELQEVTQEPELLQGVQGVTQELGPHPEDQGVIQELVLLQEDQGVIQELVLLQEVPEVTLLAQGATLAPSLL